MKKYVFLVFTLFLSWAVFGQTQMEINDIAAKEYELADKELNLIYTKIRAKYANDPLILTKLRESQLLWIRFRDSAVEALYPEGPKTVNGASMYRMLMYKFMERLTRDRIEQLHDCYMAGHYYP